MKTKNKPFVIDYDLVRRGYPARSFQYPDYADDPLEKYRPAYFVTNEHLEETVRRFGNNNGDILTVAASGDQPLLYAAYGARHIDTYDLTCCARAIMDIKNAAARNFNRDEYIKFMLGVKNAQWRVADIMSAPGMHELIKQIPIDTAEFIRRMSGARIFSAGGLVSEESLQQTLVLSPEQWRKMQQNLPQSFNFIWSDITDLHKQLNMKYDVINTSNIFEWMYQESAHWIRPTIKNLFNHLRPGGYLLGITVGYSTVIEPMFVDVANQLGAYAQIHRDVIGRETVLALQRVR